MALKCSLFSLYLKIASYTALFKRLGKNSIVVVNRLHIVCIYKERNMYSKSSHSAKEPHYAKITLFSIVLTLDVSKNLVDSSDFLRRLAVGSDT